MSVTALRNVTLSLLTFTDALEVDGVLVHMLKSPVVYVIGLIIKATTLSHDLESNPIVIV